MPLSRSRLPITATVLKWIFVCLLSCVGSQAMAARDCWTASNPIGTISVFFNDDLRFSCRGSAGEVAGAAVETANTAASVPVKYGEFETTTRFTLQRCDAIPQTGTPRSPPQFKCEYGFKNITHYYDGRPDVTSPETFGYTFMVAMACGEVMHSGAISTKSTSCKPILDLLPSPLPSCPSNNPIEPLTGLKRQPVPLLTWGRGHSFSMTYWSVPPTAGGTLSQSGEQSFGAQWHSNLHRRWFWELAGVWVFQRGNGIWKQLGIASGGGDVSERDPQPVYSADQTLLFYKDMQAGAIETYRAPEGTLVSISYIDGRRLDFAGRVWPGTLKQTGDRHLIDSIRDEAGRGISLEYLRLDNDYSGISTITDPAGGKLQFSYDAGQLSEVKFPDQTALRYLYEVPGSPQLLTGRVDERGNRFGTYRYDDQGRAIESQTGSLPSWKVRWSAAAPDLRPDEFYDAGRDAILRRQAQAAPAPTVAIITLPDGEETVWGGTVAGRAALVASRSQPAGSGCSASTSFSSYDAAGNVTQRDDFNGNRTCISNDPGRNLEQFRIEGLPTTANCAAISPSALPAGSRMVSTKWHPDWRVSTGTAESRRITTLVFNGQPDPFNGGAIASCAPASALLPDGKPIVVLCKRVEQATTDETGALGFGATAQSGVPARATSWTYNEVGQVLTEKNPLGKVVVTNVYYADTTADHTKGDLQSTTNAVGHKTQYPRYDAYGKPLEMIDTNGISTTYAYDARQRLLSTTTQGAVTGYEYWPTGLLKKATEPDGSFVTYEYDDAHRLVAVADSVGNRIDYVLDVNGNRKKEEAKDPQGTLQRTMSRVYDALGRAQQTTGRE